MEVFIILLTKFQNSSKKLCLPYGYVVRMFWEIIKNIHFYKIIVPNFENYNKLR